MTALRGALAFAAALLLALLALLWLGGRELPRVREGQPLPAPMLSRIGGFGETSFAVFRGRPLLVVVLDAECCAGAAGAAERLNRELARRDLAVMVVMVDQDRSRVDAAARAMGLTLPVAEDPGRARLGEAFGHGGLPQYYLADRVGRVTLATVGALDLDSRDFRARLEPLLSPAPW